MPTKSKDKKTDAHKRLFELSKEKAKTMLNTGAAPDAPLVDKDEFNVVYPAKKVDHYYIYKNGVPWKKAMKVSVVPKDFASIPEMCATFTVSGAAPFGAKRLYKVSVRTFIVLITEL